MSESERQSPPELLSPYLLLPHHHLLLLREVVHGDVDHVCRLPAPCLQSLLSSNHKPPRLCILLWVLRWAPRLLRKGLETCVGVSRVVTAVRVPAGVMTVITH